MGREEPGRAKMADGIAWHAVFRPLCLCCLCHLKLLVTVFSLAVHGFEKRAFVVTQECRVFLAKRLCCRHVHCILLITGMASEGWALSYLGDQQACLRNSEKTERSWGVESELYDLGLWCW